MQNFYTEDDLRAPVDALLALDESRQRRQHQKKQQRGGSAAATTSCAAASQQPLQPAPPQQQRAQRPALAQRDQNTSGQQQQQQQPAPSSRTFRVLKRLPEPSLSHVSIAREDEHATRESNIATEEEETDKEGKQNWRTNQIDNMSRSDKSDPEDPASSRQAAGGTATTTGVATGASTGGGAAIDTTTRTSNNNASTTHNTAASGRSGGVGASGSGGAGGNTTSSSAAAHASGQQPAASSAGAGGGRWNAAGGAGADAGGSCDATDGAAAGRADGSGADTPEGLVANVEDVQFLLEVLSMKAERPVLRLSQLSSSFFVLAYRQLFEEVPVDVNVNPTTPEDRVHNARAVIEGLESKLNQSLAHISPEAVAGHDEAHIAMLLRVFCDICTPPGGTRLDDTGNDGSWHGDPSQPSGPQIMVRDWLHGLYGQQQQQPGGGDGSGGVGSGSGGNNDRPPMHHHHHLGEDGGGYAAPGGFPGLPGHSVGEHIYFPHHGGAGGAGDGYGGDHYGAGGLDGEGGGVAGGGAAVGAGGDPNHPGAEHERRRLRRVAALLSQRDVPRYHTHVCGRLVGSDGRLVRQFTGDGPQSTIGIAYACRPTSAPTMSKRPLPAMANARRDAKIERLRSEKFLQSAQDRAVREVVRQASREEVRMVQELRDQLHEQRQTFISLDKLAKEKDERLRQIYNDNVTSAVGAARGKGMRLNLHKNAAELVRREREIVDRERGECEAEVRLQFDMLRAKREAYLSHLSSWRVSVLKQDPTAAGGPRSPASARQRRAAAASTGVGGGAAASSRDSTNRVPAAAG